MSSVEEYRKFSEIKRKISEPFWARDFVELLIIATISSSLAVISVPREVSSKP